MNEIQGSIIIRGVCSQAIREEFPSVNLVVFVAVGSPNQVLHPFDCLLVAQRGLLEFSDEPVPQFRPIEGVIMVFIPFFEDVHNILIAKGFSRHFLYRIR